MGNDLSSAGGAEKKAPSITDEIHEAGRSAMDRAIHEIIFPSIRDTIGRVLHSMVDGLLNFDNPNGYRPYNQTRYNYARPNERRNYYNEGKPSYRNGGYTSKYSYNNSGNSNGNNSSPSSWDSSYVFRTYLDADNFKTDLEEIIERYPRHAVSIVDANSAAGITMSSASANKVDINWGWTTLCGVPSIRTLHNYFKDPDGHGGWIYSDGYEVALPQPEWIGSQDGE